MFRKRSTDCVHKDLQVIKSMIIENDLKLSMFRHDLTSRVNSKESQIVLKLFKDKDYKKQIFNRLTKKSKTKFMTEEKYQKAVMHQYIKSKIQPKTIGHKIFSRPDYSSDIHTTGIEINVSYESYEEAEYINSHGNRELKNSNDFIKEITDMKWSDATSNQAQFHLANRISINNSRARMKNRMSSIVLTKMLKNLKDHQSVSYNKFRHEMLQLLDYNDNTVDSNRLDRVKSLIIETLPELIEESESETTTESTYLQDEDSDVDTNLSLIYTRMFVYNSRHQKSRNFSGSPVDLELFLPYHELDNYGFIDGISNQLNLKGINFGSNESRESLIALSHMYNLKKLLGITKKGNRTASNDSMDHAKRSSAKQKRKSVLMFPERLSSGMSAFSND